jgi:hypothetical protein
MERKSRRGRPATGHIKVQFNIRPEINRMIDLRAAREEITRRQYIEEPALKAIGWLIERQSPTTPPVVN